MLVFVVVHSLGHSVIKIHAQRKIAVAMVHVFLLEIQILTANVIQDFLENSATIRVLDSVKVVILSAVQQVLLEK